MWGASGDKAGKIEHIRGTGHRDYTQEQEILEITRNGLLLPLSSLAGPPLPPQHFQSEQISAANF